MAVYVLALLWTAWCVLHSALISTTFVGLLHRHVPQWLIWHRLAYNLVSLVTLFPLALYTRGVAVQPVFSWQGMAVIPRVLLLLAAGLLFYGGARHYDLATFLGFRQLRDGAGGLLLNLKEEFTTAGVFGLTRHPWYLGSLLLLWSALPVYSAGAVVAVVVLSLYLVVGTVLEERKIMARHGEAYRHYQRQVSMLLPWKWLRRHCLGWTDSKKM
jgi:methanethiol S-methyltransferase